MSITSPPRFKRGPVADAARADTMVCTATAGVTHCEARLRHYTITGKAELVAHVGGSRSFAQKLLIRRAARAMLRLELLDAKMSTGNGTDHDARTFGGLNNALRLALRELGVRETKPKPIPTIAEIAARHKSEGA
jgi:hypothetical protein